jgi:hypothetical protein
MQADFWIGVTKVRSWHFADNPVAPAFVRFWTKADIDQTIAALFQNANQNRYADTN